MSSSSRRTEQFPERLKIARTRRELSQDGLAKRANLQPSAISHFETGTRKPSFDNLKRLAAALDVTTDYLLGRSETPDTSGTSGRLHRDMNKLSADDLRLTEEFVEMLIRRDQYRTKK